MRVPLTRGLVTKGASLPSLFPSSPLSYTRTSSLAIFGGTTSLDPLFSHYVPLQHRSSSQPLFRLDALQRIVRRDRTEPTRELNYTPDHWRLHKSPYRKLRHLSNLWYSSPLQRLLFPDLCLVASTAAALTYYKTVTDNATILFADSVYFGTGSTAIGRYIHVYAFLLTLYLGILAAFRLNASYGRYTEAREIWGELNNASRDLARNALMFLDHEDADRLCLLTKAFAVATHFHVNAKGGHYHLSHNDPNFERILQTEYYAEMKCMFEEDETNVDLQRIYRAYCRGDHVPLLISQLMANTIKNAHQVDPIYIKQLDDQVVRLVRCLGMCERVLRTPIPTSFSRHTSRLFSLWAFLLPFGLYPSLETATLPVSVICAYAVLGIEDIGVQLEEPFNILPLRQYTEGIRDGVQTLQRTAQTVENSGREEAASAMAA